MCALSVFCNIQHHQNIDIFNGIISNIEIQITGEMKCEMQLDEKFSNLLR